MILIKTVLERTLIHMDHLFYSLFIFFWVEKEMTMRDKSLWQFPAFSGPLRGTTLDHLVQGEAGALLTGPNHPMKGLPEREWQEAP